MTTTEGATATDDGLPEGTPEQAEQARVPKPSLLAQLKAMAGGILRKLTGRDMDTRLMTEAQRTQLAADKAEQEAGRIAAWTDPRPLRIAALMDWRLGIVARRLRLRLTTGRLTGSHIDTYDMTEAQRTREAHRRQGEFLEYADINRKPTRPQLRSFQRKRTIE